MKGTSAYLHIVGLQNHAPVFRPILIEREYDLLEIQMEPLEKQLLEFGRLAVLFNGFRAYQTVDLRPKFWFVRLIISL